jgi:hypothetical protein
MVLVYKCGHEKFNTVKYQYERCVLNNVTKIIRYTDELKKQLVDLYQIVPLAISVASMVSQM